MSFYNIREAVEELFSTQFPLSEPNVDIAVENDDYKATNKNWVRLSIRYADIRFNSLGSTGERYRGLIQVQIFTPIGYGTVTDERIASNISNIFRGVNYRGVRCNSSNKIPAEIRDGWLQSLSVTEFWYDETY